MTIYAQDTFTDVDGTLLTAHTPEVGGPWHDLVGPATIQSNQLVNPDFTFSWDYCDNAIPTADYEVSVRVTSLRNDWDAKGGVYARNVGSSSSGYAGLWSTFDAQWVIWKSGTNETIIATSSAVPLAVGQTRLVTLRCAADRISLIVDGSEVCIANDSDYASIGRAGIMFEPLLHDAMTLDAFQIDDLTPLLPPTLSGRGSIILAEPNWIQVAVSDLPGPATFGNAEPENWYGAALLTWGTANGLLTAHPVTREVELIPLPPGMTELHYWVAPGLSITIVERSTP